MWLQTRSPAYPGHSTQLIRKADLMPLCTIFFIISFPLSRNSHTAMTRLATNSILHPDP